MTADELEVVLSRVLAEQSAFDWTSLVAPAIWFCALVVAIVQLSGLVKQVNDDHERSRRERTVDVIRYYQAGTKPEHNKIVQLLDRIPKSDLISLRDGRPVSLQGELKEIACSILSGQFRDAYTKYCGSEGEKANETNQLSHAETMHIRFYMLDILNHYETCLVPWQLGIVDRSTIEEQFWTLVDVRDGKHKLQSARSVFGVDKFPATESFRAHLYDRDTDKSSSKPPLAKPTE